MKLQRFTAASNYKAIMLIQQTLGPDALIYATRRTAQGIEMLAGLPHSDDSTILNQTRADSGASDTSETQRIAIDESQVGILELLTQKLQLIDESVKSLTKQINTKSLPQANIATASEKMKRNLIHYHLDKIGFSADFAENFSDQFVRSRKANDPIDERSITFALQKMLKIDESECIEGSHICALLGPTGVGKTTTIAKIAKRYIKKYGNHSLGFITTDYLDVTAKNHLAHYANLFQVDLEYANNASELTAALDIMQNKKLILIDTYGVSQRDDKHVHSIVDLIESQNTKISTFLTLPCNVQESVLNEIVAAFKTKTLRGCILTKQDESVSINAAIAVCLTNKLKISYLCDGQDINQHIQIPSIGKLMSYILKQPLIEYAIPEIEKLDKQQEESSAEKTTVVAKKKNNRTTSMLEQMVPSLKKTARANRSMKVAKQPA
jgi:flagellar biosynthesis protein FlhF